MQDNAELVATIAAGIAAEPQISEVNWTEAAVVFSFEDDGFCSGHFGYAYDADGAWTPFTVDDWQTEKDAEMYWSWLRDGMHDPIRQMLFQFNRVNGRYHADFHYGSDPRWQVTPANLDSIVPRLRPSL